MRLVEFRGTTGIVATRAAIANVSSAAETRERPLIVQFSNNCFLETGSIALLTSWLLSEKLTGRQIELRGDGPIIGYLARMNFHRVLGLKEPDHNRRPEGGKFIPIRLVRDADGAFESVNAIADTVLQQLEGAPDFLPAFEWAVNEIVDNVFIHSQSKSPGVVCAQMFPASRRLNIAICDGGIGIRRTLSERFGLDSDEAAITKALQRGVTRNVDVGQGNGMAGSLEIMKKNGGSLFVWSGTALYRMINGNDAGFEIGPDIAGTGVELSFNSDRPVDLGQTWIGERGSTYIEVEAQRTAERGIIIRDVCSHTASRPPATRLRRKILALLPELDGKLKLDFTGVKSLSSSFLDELLGRLNVELGSERFNERIIVSGLSELHLNMANNVIGQRLALQNRDPSNANAWIGIDVPKPGNAARYALSLEGEPEMYAGVQREDWFLLCKSTGRATRIGKVSRLRQTLEQTTFYFDRVVMIDDGVSLTTTGINVPPPGPLARLQWPVFISAVSAITGRPLEDVQIVDDVVYVRELLHLAVIDDLLGPAGGPHELIKDMSVRDRYLVGKLAPRRPDGDQAARVEPASAAEESGDLEDERTAPLHEPGAEFASASGRVEPEDDALDEIDTTNNQSLVPSSMGLTFCVAPDVKTLAVEARWGRYERVPNDEHDIVKTRKNRANRSRGGGKGPGLATDPVRRNRLASSLRRPDQTIETGSRRARRAPAGNGEDEQRGREARHSVPRERPTRARRQQGPRLAVPARDHRRSHRGPERQSSVPAPSAQRGGGRRPGTRPARTHLP